MADISEKKVLCGVYLRKKALAIAPNINKTIF
jgi:hypothetical protein